MSAVDFNQQVIDEFRENAGLVGGPFQGRPMLLLHHVGAKSGEKRIAPLVYLPHDDEYVIFASKGGAPENPGWYHNLKANPDTTIEVGAETVQVTAREASDELRERLMAEQIEAMPQFADYQTKTTRTIPAIVLTPRT